MAASKHASSHTDEQSGSKPDDIKVATDAVDEAQLPSREEWVPSKHEKAIIYTLAAINVIVALDATIVITPLNKIINDLGGDATQAFWIGTSYLLVNAVTMPIICSISNIFGRLICLTFALLAFSAGTICCCTAQNVPTMLVGRSIQGTDIVPLRYRPKWYGVTLGAWALGLSLGPVLGGAIAQSTTWRWIFYLMFPFCAFGLVAVPYLLTLRPKESSARVKLSRVDWVGCFIFMGSATSFLIAVPWGGLQHDWDSAETLAPLIVGAAGLIATLFYEACVAKEPFLRHSLYHDASSIVTYIPGCMQGLVMYGLLYYGPFYTLSIKGFNSLHAGAAMLPCMVAVTVTGIVSGRLVTRFNNYRWAICIGWFVASVGSALFLIWPAANDSTAVWVITYVIAGVGEATVLNAQNFASQAMCKPGDEASAAAMYVFARQFGMALGVGIGGTTFQNVMTLKLRWESLPTDIAKIAEGYISVLDTLPDDLFKHKVLDAYKFGFIGANSFYLGLSFTASVLSVVFVKNIDLTRKLESGHHLDGKRMTRHCDTPKE
ncbi:major facilitator superfamily transporter [Xylariaceae sp. FL0016]|nr:major facilitator superfamily transporter [Xylariaceae sp. FL0016]